MELNLVKYKNNSITVSREDTGSMTDLQKIHTVKYPLVWETQDTTEFAWIKANFYELVPLKTLIFDYSGTVDTIKIEISSDNFNWETISESFVPSQQLIDVDYYNDFSSYDPWRSSYQHYYEDVLSVSTFLVEAQNKGTSGISEPNWLSLTELNDTISDNDITWKVIDIKEYEKQFSFLKITFENPSGFTLNGLEIYCDVTVENTNIISHNYYNLFSEKLRDDYPLFPDLVKDQLKMLEGYEQINLKIFDESIFETSSISYIDNSGTLTFSTTDLSAMTDVKYIWDFDDPNIIYIEGSDGDVNTSTLLSDVDLSAYSVNELSGKVLEILNIGSANEGYYVIDTHTNSSSGNTITITTTFSEIEDELEFYIQDFTEITSLANPNIIATNDPLTDQNHIYTKSKKYYPRLILQHPNFILEFINYYEKV